MFEAIYEVSLILSELSEPVIKFNEETNIKKIKTATDNLAKEFKKNDMVDLRLMDEPFELNPGDCVKIARILIKNARATGAVSADKRYFVGNDEIITRAKIYQETQAISNIFEFLDTIGLDREYMSEVQEIIGITKKKAKKRT